MEGLDTSDAFVRCYAEQKALRACDFQCMPIGRDQALDLLPTPEQRMHRLLDLREKHDILLPALEATRIGFGRQQ